MLERIRKLPAVGKSVQFVSWDVNGAPIAAELEAMTGQSSVLIPLNDPNQPNNSAALLMDGEYYPVENGTWIVQPDETVAALVMLDPWRYSAAWEPFPTS